MKIVTDANLIEFKRKCDEVYSKKGEDSSPNAVLYIPQSLQDAQKQQARTNIGAQVAGSYITESQFQIKADKTYVDQELAKKQPKGNYVLTDAFNTALGLKQDKIDSSLTTSDQTVVGAINELKTSITGIQQDILNEAHFRGYFATNSELQESPGNINDYAYSAESGTVWTHNGSSWTNTEEPVPDKMTPLSNSTPLQDGTASAGSSNEAARGDHVHPTDTSRASNVDFQAYVNNKANPHAVTWEMIKPAAGVQQNELASDVNTILTNVASVPKPDASHNDKLLGVVNGQYAFVSSTTTEEVDALFA